MGLLELLHQRSGLFWYFVYFYHDFIKSKYQQIILNFVSRWFASLQQSGTNSFLCPNVYASLLLLHCVIYCFVWYSCLPLSPATMCRALMWVWAATRPSTPLWRPWTDWCSPRTVHARMSLAVLYCCIVFVYWCVLLNLCCCCCCCCLFFLLVFVAFFSSIFFF